jgi:hypothetical protein
MVAGEEAVLGGGVGKKKKKKRKNEALCFKK